MDWRHPALPVNAGGHRPGLRAGEAFGLHVEDLDLATGLLFVRRSIYHKQEVSPSLTDNSLGGSFPHWRSAPLGRTEKFGLAGTDG
jgi:hypothetical protein